MTPPAKPTTAAADAIASTAESTGAITTDPRGTAEPDATTDPTGAAETVVPATTESPDTATAPPPDLTGSASDGTPATGGTEPPGATTDTSTVAGAQPRAAGRGTRPGWRRRRVAWGLVLVAVAVLLAYGSIDNAAVLSDAERAAAIARSLRCPQCAGESVAESNVSVAREIRADIARRVDTGQSDSQIRAAYAELWGESILLTPPSSGFGSLVWIVPTAVGLTAAAALTLAYRRWR